MQTYWIGAKGAPPIDTMISPLLPAGIPQTPSLQRNPSRPTSTLAAVVFGMMQASKRNAKSTRKEEIKLCTYIRFYYFFHFY